MKNVWAWPAVPVLLKMRITLRMTLQKTYILSYPEYKSHHSFIQAYGHSPPVLPWLYHQSFYISTQIVKNLFLFQKKRQNLSQLLKNLFFCIQSTLHPIYFSVFFVKTVLFFFIFLSVFVESILSLPSWYSFYKMILLHQNTEF